MPTATIARIANDSPFCDSRAQMKKLEDDLTNEDAMNAPLHEIEQLLEAQGRELMRSLMQAHFDVRSAQERAVPVQGADGVARSRVRIGSRKVETKFGEVELERGLYQAPGVEGLAPLDALMELPAEKYSYEVRRLVAEQSSRSSFNEVVALIEKCSGAQVPKRQVEELSVRAAQDFDAFYQQRTCEAEATDDLLVLSFDGKGIPMLLEDLRAATRQAAQSTPRRLQTRLARGEKPNRRRMAQVATVYTVAPHPRTMCDVLHGFHDKQDQAERPRPTNKRVWASVEHRSEQVIDDGFAEALRRDPERKRRWVVLIDGHRDQRRLVEKAARKVGAEITIVLDIVHVLEYLWRAAYVFCPQGSQEAEAWVQDRLLQLLDGRSGGAVAKSMRLMVKRRDIDEQTAKPVMRAANYLARNTRLLHYDRALADGLPIATGVIEGACRYLVQDRMGRTGARWSLQGAEAILRLRALTTSGDFDDYWTFHLAKEHERTHQSRYPAASIPNPIPSKRARLRLVK